MSPLLWLRGEVAGRVLWRMHPTTSIIRAAIVAATYLSGFWDEFPDQFASSVRLVPISETLRSRTKGSGVGNNKQEVGSRTSEVGIWDVRRKLSAYLVLSTKYWVLGPADL